MVAVLTGPQTLLAMIIQELTPQLIPGVRTRIGEEIAIPIAAREPLDPTRFLERVLVLRLKD